MKQSSRPSAPGAEWAPIDRKGGRLKRMQRRTLTFANLALRVYPTRKAWMVTLTYRENEMWQADHVRTAINALRSWCARQGVRLVFEWVMELTKQGRPHYHLVVWLPRHLECPKFDSRGWWPHGMTNRIKAKFAPGYLAKYVSKGVKQWDTGEPVGLPRRARMHGSGGLTGVALIELRWWMLPRWMRDNTIDFLGEAKRTTGGWICKSTGEFFPTPYEVSFSRGMAWFRLKSPLSWESPKRTPSNEAANSWSFSTYASA